MFCQFSCYEPTRSLPNIVVSNKSISILRSGQKSCLPSHHTTSHTPWAKVDIPSSRHDVESTPPALQKIKNTIWMRRPNPSISSQSLTKYHLTYRDSNSDLKQFLTAIPFARSPVTTTPVKVSRLGSLNSTPELSTHDVPARPLGVHRVGELELCAGKSRRLQYI